MDASHESTEVELTAEAKLFAPTAEILGIRLYELAAAISDSEDSEATLDDDGTELDRHVSDSEEDGAFEDDFEITGENVLEDEGGDVRDAGSNIHVDFARECPVREEVGEGGEVQNLDNDEHIKAVETKPSRRNPVYSDEYQDFPTTRGTLGQIMKVNDAATAAIQPPPAPETAVPTTLMKKPERTYTIAFQLPCEDEPTKIRLPFSTSYNTLLNELQALSVPAAKACFDASPTGWTLEDGPWFYSIIKGYGTAQCREDQVRCLGSNLQYLAMVSEMSRAKANFAIFWHAKVRLLPMQI
ncbi:MAG: hypothetical protein M1836_002706 [Candelina mexicana]|nr:MAG: hypothetical protein M1836_002706 [Candelina mexicana]